MKQMPKALNMPKLTISSDYIESFKNADKTFKYQVVFDPLKSKLVSINSYGDDVKTDEDLTYAGVYVDLFLSFVFLDFYLSVCIIHWMYMFY